MKRDNFDPSGFEIIRSLGKGGTASVYLARRLSDDRLFALKTSLVEDPVALSSFRPLIEKEFQLIGGIKFPGLVRVAGLADMQTAHPFLILEYCRGKTLDQIGRVESPELLMNLLSSISINLYFVHILGISHGDLKPHNIFLTEDLPAFGNGSQIRSKISDFSLALRTQEAPSFRLGTGTVGFIAPETIDSSLLNPRSDIFALGIIGYILATGRNPFIADEREADPVIINAAIKETVPPAPILLNKLISAEFSELILSMLSKTPEKRPSNTYLICRQLEKLGSKYPYHKAIRPKYLLGALKCADNDAFFRNPIVNLDVETTGKILDYAGDDGKLLRNALEINFTNGGIYWKDGRLVGDAAKIIWPSRIRKYIGRDFRRLSYTERKKSVLGAIVGRLEDLPALGITIDDISAFPRTRPLLTLLRSKLSKKTLRRISNRMAQKLAGNPAQVRLAARLFLQAEDLDSGFEIVVDSINDLVEDSSYPEAFSNLRTLEQLCRLKGDIEKLKMVLMKRGDIEKMIGEAATAEKTYLSLVELYRGCRPDRLLAETYKDLGDLYKMKQDYYSGIESLEKAKLIYEELGEKLELSHTLNNIGNIYAISNELDRAYRTFRIALHLQKNLKAAGDVASTLNNIAIFFYMRGRFSRALKLFNLSLKLNVEAGIEVEIARSNNNIGYLYLELGQFGKAKEHLRESLDINRKINNKKEQLFNLNNLAQGDILLGNLKEALNYLKEGRNLADRLSDLPHRAEFIATTAIVQRRMGLYGSALESIKTALELAQNLADRRDAALWYIYKAEIYQDLKDPEKANESLSEAERLINPEDKKALFKFNLVKGVNYRKLDCIAVADRLAVELNSPRDRWVVALKEAMILLDSGELEKGHELIMKLNSLYIPSEAEIESSRFHLVVGVDKYSRGEIQEAQRDFVKGLERSLGKGFLPEVIESSVYLGRISADLSEFENAYKNYRKALNGYKSIDDDIRDEGLRKRFLSDEKIADLALEIKRMNKVLA